MGAVKSYDRMSLEGGKSIEEVKEELNFFYELSSAVGFPVRRNSTFESDLTCNGDEKYLFL